MKTANESAGISDELRLIVRQAGEVWRLVPHRHKMALGCAAFIMAATSICNVALPLLLGSLVDGIKTGTEQADPKPHLYRLTAWFLGLIAGAYLLREGLNVLRRFLVENTCTRIHRDVSLQLVAHLLRVPLTTLSHDKVGALHGRIFRSIDGFIRFLRLSFLDFFPALFTGTFAISAALFKHPVLGFVMIGVIPTSVFLTIRQLMSQKGVRLKLLRTSEEIDGALVEQLGGMEYIRAANTQAIEIKRLDRATEHRRSTEIRHHFEMSLYGCAKALNEGLFHILVVGFSIYYAIQGTVSFGDVLTFSILFLNVMAPLNEVHRVIDEGHESSLRVADLLDMLNEPIDKSFEATPPAQPQLRSGEPVIVVDNLQVEYLSPQGQTVRALDGISLTIRHGETIGVAGRSGCGKSTWLKVMLRLNHPSGGSVTLGGVPLSDVSRKAVGDLLGYVGQQPFVFAGTVAENIAYGIPNVTPERIRRAAEMANLHEEIMEMPRGYESEISERGHNLSGGQRQRLAIARILLRQPPILILDEATSALDNISERHVQRELGLTNSDRTTILVAHRLSTLRDADRIFVFDDGRIIEVGTYNELVQKGGVFTELVMSAENGITANGSSPNGTTPVSIATGEIKITAPTEEVALQGA